MTGKPKQTHKSKSKSTRKLSDIYNKPIHYRG